ncbi:hypothetical protein MTO96_012867 [Rhipicephalus appendiculatus]
MLEEHRRLRTQSELSLPRHPPRYISYKASRRGVMGLSTLHECCSQAERSSSVSESEPQCVSKEEQEKVGVEAPLLRRTSEKRDLACQQKCVNRSEARTQRAQQLDTHSTLMLPKDEQIRKLLYDDQEIVVTVETRKGRHRLLTTPSPPPVFSLRKRGLPLYESTTTEDSFMKDLKQRRVRLGGRHSADLSTAVTASTLTSTSPNVTATRRPSDGVALAALHKAQQADALRTMRTVFDASAPVHGSPLSAEPAKQRVASVDPAPTSTNRIAASGQSVTTVQKAKPAPVSVCSNEIRAEPYG